MELLDFGYLGLFLATFLSATIVPFPSEGILIGMYTLGFNSVPVIIVATIGNVLGSAINYLIGYWGSSDKVINRLKINKEKLHSWEEKFAKWGMYLGLIAWVPIIGDPMVIALGFLRVPSFGLFVMITIGKLMRYIVLTTIYFSLI